MAFINGFNNNNTSSTNNNNNNKQNQKEDKIFYQKNSMTNIVVTKLCIYISPKIAKMK